jgi:hypothetical protein
MGAATGLEETVVGERDKYLAENPGKHLHHLSRDLAALWPKMDHLLYQPILGVDRPRCFYYYQGDGVAAL